jgi:TRAP transporter 4TM/12TM fusion protein
MSTDNTETEGLDMDLADVDERVDTRGSHFSGMTKRELSGRTKLVALAIAVLAGLYHTVTPAPGVGLPGAFVHRPIHLVFMAVLVFLWYGVHTGESEDRVPWYDWLLIGITIPSVLYLAWAIQFDDLAARAGAPTTIDIIFGAITILIVLEMTRRTTGIILPMIAGAFIVYAHIGPVMPGLLSHRGYGMDRIVGHLYLTTEGVFGIPLGVSATFVVLFIIFGAFLEVTGIGDWFIDLAYGYTGRMAGGPAKTSVLASGFMASLNGSAVANTATTGAFTIPLMKRTGFDSHYSAAVESSASSGGQIMPPVMGAGAFIMAVWTGIPYIEIIAAATIPALLYFLCVGMAVHFRAKKQGLEGLPKENLPDSWYLLKTGIHFTIPIIVLVALLVQGYTPLFAGFVAIVLTVIVAIPSADGTKRFVDAVDRRDREAAIEEVYGAGRTATRAFDRGIRMTLVVAAACATAGIVVGVVTLTGLGLAFSSLVANLSGGVLIIGLLLTMVASIVLGMGLPTTAAYVVVAALGAPALMELGVPELASHLFIFYFAIISAITPPIMLAVFTASGIAESDPWKTGATALGIASVGFIIPFLFVYGPELILMADPAGVGWGDAVPIGLSVLTAIVGVIALSASTQGFLLTNASIVERGVLLLGALALLSPGLMTDAVGLVLLTVVVGKQYAVVNGDLSLPSVTDR